MRMFIGGVIAASVVLGLLAIMYNANETMLRRAAACTAHQGLMVNTSRGDVCIRAEKIEVQ